MNNVKKVRFPRP